MPYPYSFPLISPGDEVTAEQANEMHQAHVDNNVPTSIDDYSLDVNQMRLVEDPGNNGTESLPADLAGEIKRLRNEIKVIKSYIAQTPPSYWYSKLASTNRSYLLRDGSLAMTGKLPAKGGAGGSNNPNNCGVVFDTDNDSGLFGISDGVLGLYANGTEFLEANYTANLLKVFRPILFPATQISSTDPNALDDYEEGSWTPYLTRESTAPSLTYSTQTGKYVKIGQFVYVYGKIIVGAVTSQGSGALLIGGLPFNVVGETAPTPVLYGGWPSYTSTAHIATVKFPLFGGNYSMYLVELGTGYPFISVDIDNSMNIRFGLYYFTS
jgi:hypothetical protein